MNLLFKFSFSFFVFFIFIEYSFAVTFINDVNKPLLRKVNEVNQKSGEEKPVVILFGSAAQECNIHNEAKQGSVFLKKVSDVDFLVDADKFDLAYFFLLGACKEGLLLSELPEKNKKV